MPVNKRTKETIYIALYNAPLLCYRYIKGGLPMKRIIFHVDVNNAFLSWEALYRIHELGEETDLRTIAAVIGGDEESRHGIVVAKSEIAKSYGVKTAETLQEARRKCPNLLIVPPRHAVYKEYSQKLMSLLREYTPVIEKFSIDEAFLDMTGTSPEIETAPVDVAEQLRRAIHERLGFTVNIGVSSCKVLAKMASDFEKPNRVHRLFPEDIQEKMWPLPIGRLFLVGQSASRKLYNLGIRTIGDLAVFERSIILSHLGRQGEVIYDYANGIDDSPVQSEPADAKGYGNSMTLSQDVTSPAQAKKYLLSLCETVSSRLREDSVIAGVAVVHIKYATFVKSSHQRTLATPTNVTDILYETICQLFDECWDGSPIRLLGVSTSKITGEALRQLNLSDMTDEGNSQKREKLDSAIDAIRKKYGNSAIIRASFLEHNDK